MYTCKNKLTALVSVLLLAIPLLFAVVSVVHQKVLQVNSRLHFGTEKTETIAIDAKKITWVKKDKEILVGGNYFDVKSFRVKAGIVFLTGYFDHKEDRLVGQLKSLYQQKNNTETPVNRLAAKFLFFPVFTTQSEIVIEPGWQLATREFHLYTETMPEVTGLNESPPPRL